MHDQEKSDSGTVAVKPTNKAGQPAAEPVERRPGTKGNAEQQSTLRTQGRERVTQALNRVRQAARQRERSSPRSCTTSRSTHSERRSTRSSARPLLGWMA
jgi:hypothetical protein